jgi:hypothetical protein
VRKQQSATQLARNGQTPAAIRAAWEAVDLFKKAQLDGRPQPLADSTAPKPTAPPPTSGPPAAQPPAAAPTPPSTAPAGAPQAPNAPPPTAPAVPTTPGTSGQSRPPQAAPPAQAVSEEPTIRAVLNAFAQAYSDLNVDSVARYYPNLNREALTRSFKNAKLYRVEIEPLQFDISATTARVTCNILTTFVARAGSSQPQKNSRRVTVLLERRGDAWVIVQQQ